MFKDFPTSIKNKMDTTIGSPFFKGCPIDEKVYDCMRPYLFGPEGLGKMLNFFKEHNNILNEKEWEFINEKFGA